MREEDKLFKSGQIRDKDRKFQEFKQSLPFLYKLAFMNAIG